MRKKSCLYIFPINIPLDYRWVQSPLCIGPVIFQCDVYSPSMTPPRVMYVSIGAPSVVDKNTGVIIREGGGTSYWHRSCCPVNKSQHTRHRCVNKDVYSATSDQIDTVNVIVLFSIEKVTLPWMENIISINVQWVDVHS